MQFVTSNKHKFNEVNQLCNSTGIHLVHVPIEYEEARGDTCEQVVEHSLRSLIDKVEAPFIIEDSGLFIRSLKGFPGTYSAYVFKKIGLSGIIKLMSGETDRHAEFVSAVGYYDGKDIHIFKGVVEGDISMELRGEQGFAYDPLFIPKGYKFTFAENMSLKAKLSHRKRAFEKFISYVKR